MHQSIGNNGVHYCEHVYKHSRNCRRCTLKHHHFALIYLCYLQLLVWKELDYGSMGENEKQMLVSEVNLLRELKHPNIVRYYDRIIDRTNTTLYIVMEYCEGGDLSTLVAKCIKER